jgi:hypothetical protein
VHLVEEEGHAERFNPGRMMVSAMRSFAAMRKRINQQTHPGTLGQQGGFGKRRSGWDLNPRDGITVYALSRRAH